MSEGSFVLPARTDEQLVAAFLGGDAEAYEELVRRYSRRIFNFVYRMIGSYADADDVAQDVFVQVYRSLPAARTDLPFKPWLYVIARNKCLDFVKRKRPVLFADVDGPDDEGSSITERVPDPDPLPEELAERADLQRILHEAVLELPERYRQVVAMRYTGDLSFAEIADALNVPENTVKTHFHRAKALLRTWLLARL
ncbi:MAG TPA: RNA polymerase sigma factor [Dehalococcoidia bacterium]|nr:RNA polymerase sigma factor [Dehalococcoidia bacterium]